MQQQQQQQPNQNGLPAVPLSAVTTEEIQKYLDENKNLIFAILENQNHGKIAESAQYQAILQKNLMYLAAVADAQPPPSMAPSQPPNAAPQLANHIQQAGPGQQQLGVSGPKLPFQLNAHPSQDPQYHLLHFQQQQQLQGHISLGAGGANGMHQMMHPGIGGLGTLMDVRGTKQGTPEAGSNDGQGKSASGHAPGAFAVALGMIFSMNRNRYSCIDLKNEFNFFSPCHHRDVLLNAVMLLIEKPYSYSPPYTIDSM